MKKFHKSDFLRFALIFVILFCVSSCGQKGPLYYPDKDKSSSDFQNN